MNANRLTARTLNDVAYLAKVLPSEQEVEASKNTCERIYESCQKLADYEDAEENGKLIRLPCKIGSTVYTVDAVWFPCRVCEKNGRANTEECYRLSHTPPFTGAPYECPNAFEINEHICEGFSIGKDKDGNTTAGYAGEWGYEGLETFIGQDGKQYYSREDAEEAKKALEAIK